MNPAPEHLEGLSNDQRILLECHQAIKTGEFNEKYLYRRIGPISPARWLTLAIRILAAYTRTPNPSDPVIALVKYIVDIYIPGWFKFKNSRMDRVPEIVFDLWKVMKKEFSGELCTLFQNCVQKLGFCFIKQNFILSLVCSKEKDIRFIGVETIRRCRDSLNTKCNEYAKKIPTLSFDCEKWTQMINLDSVQKHDEPPATRDFSIPELHNLLEKDMLSRSFPCHSQSVERAVQMVSQTCPLVYGQETRHQYLKVRMLSQIARKGPHSKEYYESIP